MDKQDLKTKGILDQEYADQQIRQVPAPYFEIGQIATPRYDIDLMPIFTEKSLKPVRFSHENQAYAEFVYRPDGASNILNMATFDSDYVQEKSKTPLDRVISHSKFALAHSSVKQILSTLDHRMLFSVSNLQQMVNGECLIPKVWSSLIHTIGNKPSPYGHIEMRHFDQTLIDFMCYGIEPIAHHVKKNDLIRFLDSKEDFPKIMDMLKSFSTLKDYEDGYFMLSEDPNVNFIRETSCYLWDQEVKDSIVVTEGKTNIKIRMMSSSDIIKKGITTLEFNDTLTKLKVRKDKQSRLVALLYLMNGVNPPDNLLSYVSEFILIKGSKDTLVLLFRLIFRLFSSEGQPILDRLYKCETFKPSGVGHSAQLIAVQEGNMTYQTKVNLSKYPQALGNVLKTTRSVRIVKEVYSSHTALKQEDSSIFVMKDASKFFS